VRFSQRRECAQREARLSTGAKQRGARLDFWRWRRHMAPPYLSVDDRYPDYFTGCINFRGLLFFRGPR
jgi:hypothetical protein